MTSYLKNIVLLLFLSLLLANCRDPEPDPPEQPPTITIRGQNPLKTGIYMPLVADSVTAYSLYGVDSLYVVDSAAVDTSLLGYYQIAYRAVSLSGMTAEAERDVWVVVKPESMKGSWDVSLNVYPNSTSNFVDSLSVEKGKLILNAPLNNNPELKIELSLAANLQDSVYIFEQYRPDSVYCVFGAGTIDERANKMILQYFIVGNFIPGNHDTLRCSATYSRKTTLTK